MMERSKVFISHRHTDEKVAVALKYFLIATHVPTESIFCSSIPGFDVKERISKDVKDNLKRSSVIILLLSRDYYRSPYCVNEAGVAWYLDSEVSVIPIAFPEIDESKMEGFLNHDYRLYRLDNSDDVAAIYDIVYKKLGVISASFSIVNKEIQTLISSYNSFLQTRPDGDFHGKISVVPSETMSLHASLMISYAAQEGRIEVSKDLMGATYLAGTHNMNASQEAREIATWDEALEDLETVGYIKKTYNKNAVTIYTVTAKGFQYADEFSKDINLDVSPSELLAELSETRPKLSANEKKIYEFMCDLDEGITLQELRAYAEFSATTVSRLVKSLIEKGYVESRGSRNKRQFYAICS